MNTKLKLQAIGLAALIGGAVLVGPLHSQAAEPQRSGWYKPPMPCVLMRSKVKGLHRSGWCPSARMATLQKLDVLTVSAGGLDPLIFSFADAGLR